MKFSDKQKNDIKYLLRKHLNNLVFLYACAMRDARYLNEYELTRNFEEDGIIEHLEQNPGVIEPLH